MKVKAIIKVFFVASSILLFSYAGISQGPGGPGGPGPDPDPDPPSGAAVPLDLGLSVFIAAGIGYAAKKRMDKKKNQTAI